MPHKLRKIRKTRGSRTQGYGRIGQHRDAAQKDTETSDATNTYGATSQPTNPTTSAKAASPHPKASTAKKTP